MGWAKRTVKDLPYNRPFHMFDVMAVKGISRDFRSFNGVYLSCEIMPEEMSRDYFYLGFLAKGFKYLIHSCCLFVVKDCTKTNIFFPPKRTADIDALPLNEVGFASAICNAGSNSMIRNDSTHINLAYDKEVRCFILPCSSGFLVSCDTNSGTLWFLGFHKYGLEDSPYVW
jgi:hypothetical protein